MGRYRNMYVNPTERSDVLMIHEFFSLLSTVDNWWNWDRYSSMDAWSSARMRWNGIRLIQVTRGSCTDYVKIVSETVSLNDMFKVDPIDPKTRLMQEAFHRNQRKHDRVNRALDVALTERFAGSPIGILQHPVELRILILEIAIIVVTPVTKDK